MLNISPNLCPDLLKLRFQPMNDYSVTQVISTGGKSVLDLTLKSSKTWESIVQHLEKKWNKIPNIRQRLMIQFTDCLGNKSVNMGLLCASFPVRQSLCWHPVIVSNLSKKFSDNEPMLIPLQYGIEENMMVPMIIPAATPFVNPTSLSMASIPTPLFHSSVLETTPQLQGMQYPMLLPLTPSTSKISTAYEISENQGDNSLHRTIHTSVKNRKSYLDQLSSKTNYHPYSHYHQPQQNQHILNIDTVNPNREDQIIDDHHKIPIIPSTTSALDNFNEDSCLNIVPEASLLGAILDINHSQIGKSFPTSQLSESIKSVENKDSNDKIDEGYSVIQLPECSLFGILESSHFPSSGIIQDGTSASSSKILISKSKKKRQKHVNWKDKEGEVKEVGDQDQSDEILLSSLSKKTNKRQKTIKSVTLRNNISTVAKLMEDSKSKSNSNSNSTSSIKMGSKLSPLKVSNSNNSINNSNKLMEESDSKSNTSTKSQTLGKVSRIFEHIEKVHQENDSKLSLETSQSSLSAVAASVAIIMRKNNDIQTNVSSVNITNNKVVSDSQLLKSPKSKSSYHPTSIGTSPIKALFTVRSPSKPRSHVSSSGIAPAIMFRYDKKPHLRRITPTLLGPLSLREKYTSFFQVFK